MSCIGLCVGAGFYFIAIITTIVTYLILSYSYIFTDKLDHFEVIDLELDVTEEISDFIVEIERVSDRLNLELKQIKDISEENKKYNSVKIVCKYNNKMLTKNKIITEFSSIQKLKNVSVISN